MPSYRREGEFHFATHIPGPSHNSVGIRFEREPCEPKLVKLPVKGNVSHKLEEAKILAVVLAGVKEANASLGTNFCPAEIKYFEDDSPRYNIYRVCAYWLVRKLGEESDGKTELTSEG